MPWWRGREKEVEKTELDQIIERISVAGLQRYIEECKRDDWIEKIYNTTLRAIYRRLHRGEKFWLGEHSDAEIKRILEEAIKTYIERFSNKLILSHNVIDEICVCDILGLWLDGYSTVRLERKDEYGVPVTLKVKVDEKPVKRELYIRVHKEVARTCLALSNKELKGFNEKGVRCDYRLSRIKEEPVLESEQVVINEETTNSTYS
jgi:hypothetical protein